jgi:hypothetical protein
MQFGCKALEKSTGRAKAPAPQICAFRESIFERREHLFALRKCDKTEG